MQKMFVILHRFVYWLITNNEEKRYKAYVQVHGCADGDNGHSNGLYGR